MALVVFVCFFKENEFQVLWNLRRNDSPNHNPSRLRLMFVRKDRIGLPRLLFDGLHQGNTSQPFPGADF